MTIENSSWRVLDGVRVQRSSRASAQIAVALAVDNVIPREEAVMRIEPATLSELLHRQIDPSSPRDRIVSGIAASPGAASGRIVLTANEAQASAARSEPFVLVRLETTPEDIRGMHAAAAVLTMRGGVTSHAAVIGRGLGLPCVVGASDLVSWFAHVVHRCWPMRRLVLRQFVHWILSRASICSGNSSAGA